ncbi:MAG: hypothetical protein KC413_00080 [Anaerolineales bacterium]|nr:hypothetical protein [Anaerolineales bacterium]
MSFLFALMFVIFLGACTAGGSEPGVVPPTELPELVPALDTVSPGGLVQPPETVTAVPPEPYPASDAAAGSEVITSQAYPAQADLSQLTPQPVEEAYPVTAPQPGVPDMVTAVAHQVSQDLAQRLNIDIGAITTVIAEEREWSDSSLGCPSLDMTYLDVITPGYQIVLEASGESYAYHTDMQGNFILCGADGRPLTQ